MTATLYPLSSGVVLLTFTDWHPQPRAWPFSAVSPVSVPGESWVCTGAERPASGENEPGASWRSCMYAVDRGRASVCAMLEGSPAFACWGSSSLSCSRSCQLTAGGQDQGREQSEPLQLWPTPNSHSLAVNSEGTARLQDSYTELPACFQAQPHQQGMVRAGSSSCHLPAQDLPR